MIIAGDKVKFNNSYSYSDELKNKEYTVRLVKKQAGVYYAWLESFDGFVPLDAIELIQRGFIDWECN